MYNSTSLLAELPTWTHIILVMLLLCLIVVFMEWLDRVFNPWEDDDDDDNEDVTNKNKKKDKHEPQR